MSHNEHPQSPSKRNLFKGLAVGAAAAGLAACGLNSNGQSAEGSAAQNSGGSADHHSDQSFPFYGIHQSGITTPHQQFAIMAAFDVLAKTPKELEHLFRAITARADFLTKGGELQDGDPKLPPQGSGILGKVIKPDGLTITLSVGNSLFDERFGLGPHKPKHLQEMKDFPNDKLQREWCDGDISIQICAFSPETCQNALRDLIKNTAQFAVIRWSIDGFLPKAEPGALAARNLFGFRDGSGNPDVSKPETADAVLWSGVAENSKDEPAGVKNGSYQAVRLIRHFVEFWDRTPLQEQQTIFGREKYSGAPLGMKNEGDIPNYASDPEGKTMPTDSHMRLANTRDPEFMKRHLLYRRPFDYSRGLSKAGQLDVGLIFICYQANLDDGFIFVQKLLDFEPLEEYISPFGGGYFFTLPGAEQGGYLGQSLLANVLA